MFGQFEIYEENRNLFDVICKELRNHPTMISSYAHLDEKTQVENTDKISTQNQDLDNDFTVNNNPMNSYETPKIYSTRLSKDELKSTQQYFLNLMLHKKSDELDKGSSIENLALMKSEDLVSFILPESKFLSFNEDTYVEICNKFCITDSKFTSLSVVILLFPKVIFVF